MLVTDAHGGFGGIAQFNRDAIDALCGFDEVTEIVVLPRVIAEPGFTVPAKVSYDRAAAGQDRRFRRPRAGASLVWRTIDLVLCAHLNLMPAASSAASPALRWCSLCTAPMPGHDRRAGSLRPP